MSANDWTLLANLHKALEVAKEDHKSVGATFIFEASQHFQTLVAAALIRGSVDESLINQADIFAESLRQLNSEAEIRSSAKVALDQSLVFVKSWSLHDADRAESDSTRSNGKTVNNRPIEIDEIKSLVAGFYNIDAQELESASKHIRIVFPRQVAMYLCRELTSKSLPQIGRSFGNRDHTTVLFAYRKIGQLRKDDEQFGEEIKHLVQSLLERRSAI